MSQIDTVIEALRSEAERAPFPHLPDTPNVLYAVWVDAAGARELTSVSPEPIPPGIIYVGECVAQSARRHLAHKDIGSLTLMKNLAAVFRDAWSLRADKRGSTLREPGRDKLRVWMREHLSATVAPRHPAASTKDVLTRIDPPLRIEGWRPERTDLRLHLTAQRAELDRD